MKNAAEPRMYQRYHANTCEAQVSLDKKSWKEICLIDISASGLRFTSEDVYQLDGKLYFKLSVFNVLSEFNLKVEGHIVKVQKNRNKYTYAARFDNLDYHDQIQLDEILRSNISMDTPSHHMAEDGIYKFVFTPKK